MHDDNTCEIALTSRLNVKTRTHLPKLEDCKLPRLNKSRLPAGAPVKPSNADQAMQERGQLKMGVGPACVANTWLMLMPFASPCSFSRTTAMRQSVIPCQGQRLEEARHFSGSLNCSKRPQRPYKPRRAVESRRFQEQRREAELKSAQEATGSRACRLGKNLGSPRFCCKALQVERTELGLPSCFRA